jgi:hypothetical protein
VQKIIFHKCDYTEEHFFAQKSLSYSEDFLLKKQEPGLQAFLCRKGSGVSQGNKSVPLESFLPLACLLHILLCVKEVLFHELCLSVSSALLPQGF